MHSQKSMAYGAAATAPTLSMAGFSGSYDGKIAGLYDLEETLGSGHFAVVKLARHVFTGAKVAVKVVDKTKLDDVSKAHMFQEVRCMKLVQHPNVVRLYEVIDTQTKLYLVLELADGGDLYDYIMKHEGGLTEDLARKYFRQILRAITYCHQLHVVHRDLKPENVVFFEKLGVVKLTDFGFSNKFSPGQKLETFCGSLAYSAPEILLGDSYDAPAVDIWSLGVILYMLVCGQPPFEKANDSETLTMIMDCKYTVPPQISLKCKKLIGSMLVRDPKKRATLEEIAADPWINENATCETGDYLPLVSRQQLSDEDHAFIIQKMINGNIATKEEIMQSLDKNKYNHITATYFLLAEMKLRKRREEQALKQHPKILVPDNPTEKQICYNLKKDQQSNVKSVDTTKMLVPLNLNSATHCMNDGKVDKRNRKCSIVREEDEDECAYQNVGESNELRVTSNRRESISDGRLNRAIQDRSRATTVDSLDACAKMAVSIDATLAHKLKQIDNRSGNEAKTKIEPTPVAETVRTQVMHDTLKGLKELEIDQISAFSASSKNPVLTHRRTKLSKIRTPSCSSSEASDDDTKARNKKKLNKFVGDTPTRLRMNRRDSYDDSSDSQDQTCPSSRPYGATTNIVAASNSNVDGTKEEQKQSKEQNKSGDNRNSSHSCSHKHKHKSNDKTERHCKSELKSSDMIFAGRRRVNESQSLDRITEAQEYELRQRCLAVDTHIEQRISLFNLNSFSVAETKEEYDEEGGPTENQSQVKYNPFATETLQLKHNNNNNNQNNNIFNNVNSIEEIELILHEKKLTKSIQATGSKCLVTMKKIRKLGKYFPVVNFS